MTGSWDDHTIILKTQPTMADKLWKTAPNKALKVIKPIVHWSFVPLILYIALKQEKDLTLWQIVFPLASPSESAMQ